MSKKLIPTRRGNECPVCARTSGDCRISGNGELTLCHSFIDSDAFVSGWKFIKSNKDRIWGVFIRDNGKHPDELERLRHNQHRLDAKVSSRHKRAAAALSIEERDRSFRKLHDYIQLSQRHREKLRTERGWSDAWIDAMGCFSIAPYQEIPAGIPRNFPGVDYSGHLLWVKDEGIVFPAFDPQGRLIGAQLRRERASEGGRYRWLGSGDKSSHLPNGELPLTFCRPLPQYPLERKNPALCEGFPKAFVAAQKLGQIVIGAAGGQHRSSPIQLQDYLFAAGAKSGDTIDLLVDAGDVKNRNVLQRWADLVELLVSWGYEVQFGWWGQVTKTLCDIDELLEDDLGTIAYITPREFFALGEQHSGYTPSTQNIDRTLSRDQWELNFGFGKRLLEKVSIVLAQKRHSAWGFGKKSVAQSKSSKTYPEITSYKAALRLDTWKQAASHHKFIWDSSGTGTGKSFDAGRVTPELLGCERLFYITSDPRNPTTSTLADADWGLLDGRHQGLVTDPYGKIRRVKQGEAYTIPPNCYRVDTIGALREASIEGADSSSLICPTCPYAEACRGGHRFGYLNARMNALKLPKVRSHPASLPMPTGEDAFDYSNSALVWEEWGTILKNSRSMTVNQHDLDKLIVELVAKAPEQLIKLQPVLTALRELITGEVKQPNRFGWNHHKLIEPLPSLPDNLDLDAIASILKPNLDLLDPTVEYGVSAADLPAGQRKKFTASDDATAQHVRTTLLKQWFIPFLQVLGGSAGYLTLSYGTLTITTPDERLVDIAHAARRNIFLDATGHLDELALLLAILPSEIYHVRQQLSPGAEVKRVQVAGMGRLGQHRGKEQQRRAEAVVDELLKRHPSAGVIRFKKLAADGDYRWFVESRGVNDAQELDTLILDGIPCENLESMAAEFACLYGRPPIEGMVQVKTSVQLTNPLPEGIEPYFESSVSADPDFALFIRRRILASIHQAEGRLRASRRFGEQLTVYLLGDFALDVPVELVKASDITLEAADKTERVSLAIRAAVEQLKANGQKVTQSAIAKLTGYTRGHISRFRKLIILLIEGTISNAIAPTPQRKALTPESPPDPPPEEVEWLSSEYLPLIADSPLSELLALVDVYGKKSFNQIWNGATASTQVKILSQAIRCFLSGGELRQLALAVGVEW
jgi:hypothetical protein